MKIEENNNQKNADIKPNSRGLSKDRVVSQADSSEGALINVGVKDQQPAERIEDKTASSSDAEFNTLSNEQVSEEANPTNRSGQRDALLPEFRTLSDEITMANVLGHYPDQVILTVKVKEFIKRRITDLECEQKQAKGNDWKRSLLLLKSNLEEDAGKELK